MTMQRSRVGQVGFTLLEVLIALVILAIALGAVIKVSGQSGEILQRLRADTAATVIAEDLCARLRLAADVPPLGTQNSEVRIAGKTWQVTQTVSAGMIPGVLRVQYRVATPAPYAGQSSMVIYLYAPGTPPPGGTS
jgi:general secretion pathway protein I